MDLELRHLRYFVAVAEELHFGRAASGCTWPSRRSAADPAPGGHRRGRLLGRTSRSVALTPAGAALLARARRLLAQAEESLDEAARIGRGEEGTLDVGFVSSAITLGVPERIQAFRQRYPTVHTRLHEGQTAVTVARLLRGEVDLGIVRDAEPRPGARRRHARDGGLRRRAARKPTRTRGAAGSTPAVLRDEPFVLYPRTAGELAHRLNLQPRADAGYEPRHRPGGDELGDGLPPRQRGRRRHHRARERRRHPPGVRRQRPARRAPARSEVQLVTRTGDDRAVVRNFTGR